MNVSLTPVLENFVERKVSEGSYQTASEVVREALRLLSERDEMRRAELERMRREVGRGLEQVAEGKLARLDMKRVRAKGKTLSATRKGASLG
jgi:antitoxin ParD1/3/4